VQANLIKCEGDDPGEIANWRETMRRAWQLPRRTTMSLPEVAEWVWPG